jgi:hypothetical protein
MVDDAATLMLLPSTDVPARPSTRRSAASLGERIEDVRKGSLLSAFVLRSAGASLPSVAVSKSACGQLRVPALAFSRLSHAAMSLSADSGKMNKPVITGD